MFGIGQKFYDKYGNFNNKKFLNLLEKAKKEKYYGKKKRSGIGNIQISIFNSVSRKELWRFINKLSIFVNSGVDVKGALGIIDKQTKNVYFKKIIEEIKDNIDHGINLSETMMRFPKVFDQLTIALISVGEKTGLLGKILNEIDKSLLENIQLKGKIKSALIYPAIMIFLTIAMLTFMMIFIVPRITGAFNTAGVTLPWLTQKIVALSNFMTKEYITMLTFIVLIILIYKLINLTFKGKYFFARIAMNYPIFGYIVRMSNIVYFIKAFTVLLESGVLLLESIKTASDVVPNLAYRREVVRIKNEVEFGLTISRSLGLNLDYEHSVYLNKFFPEDFAYVINVGEETGSLGESLKRIGYNYDVELKRYIGNLATIMEPIIIVFIGVMVGTIVIGIMLPFFQLGKVVQEL